MRLIRELAQRSAEAHPLYIEATGGLVFPKHRLQPRALRFIERALLERVKPLGELQDVVVRKIHTASSFAIVFNTQSCSTCLMRIRALYAA